MRARGWYFGRRVCEIAGQSGYRWVLDPIDGTRGFISGTPTWGVLIALEQMGHGPAFGMIDQPYIGERFWGGLGFAQMSGLHGNGVAGTWYQIPIRCHDFHNLPRSWQSLRHAHFAVAECARLTRYGMDCYAYALLVAGQIDLVIEAGLNAYDIQAPIDPSRRRCCYRLDRGCGAYGWSCCGRCNA